MITITRSSFALVSSSAALCAALIGCNDSSAPVDGAGLCHSSPCTSPSMPLLTVDQQLLALRAVTAPYQELAAAQRAGWDLQFTPCMKHEAGAMGFHYVKQGLLDATVSIIEPEALLFEPGVDGKMRLVAVEHLIPFTHHAADQPPPTLYGQSFIPSPTFKVWGLHAWVWKENPAGMFAPWNPTVVCP